MDIMSILFVGAIVGAVGIIIGLLLGVAGEKFKVEVDEKEVLVRECLPGNNCGGCGYAGCDSLAKAIAAGEAPVNGCPVAGAAGAEAIGKVMGVEAEAGERKVAFVKCAGTCDKANLKYNYYGIQDCRKAAFAPGKGGKTCTYGCMGFGSCVKACQFDAIHVVNGVAVVDKEKCVACGKCIATCPNNLIELIPVSTVSAVQCSSHDKGKDVKAACEVGCIGCKACTKVCEAEAITVDNNLAHIDQEKCTKCGKCAEKCPAKIIRIPQ